MKLKLGIYVEVGEYDVEDATQVNRARLLIQEIQQLAAGHIAPPRREAAIASKNQAWQQMVSDHMRDETLNALDVTGWDIGFAARKLGCSQEAIVQRLIKYRGEGLVKKIGTKRWARTSPPLPENGSIVKFDGGRCED